MERFVDMSQMQKVQLKVYTTWREDDKPEVRRSEVNYQSACNFVNVTRVLYDLYPKLEHRVFSVYWKDSDGDDVIISSDDEMALACSQMKPMLKLYVICKDEQANDDACNITITAVADTADIGNARHCGVICDGCETHVIGFRYKCTVCDDFDLCAKCESSGLHPEHCMVRIPMPNMSKTIIKAAVKRSRHFLKSVASAANDEACKRQRRERSAERRGHGDHHGRHRRHQHHSGERDHHRRQRVSWLEIFSNYMNEFANLAGDVGVDTVPEQSKETKDKKTEPAQSSDSNSEESTPTKDRAPRCPFDAFNMDDAGIQKLISAYMGNVAFRPKQNEPTPSTSNVSAKQNDVERKQTDDTSNIDQVSVKSENSTEVKESKKDVSPDRVDDWTVINKDKDLMDAYGKASAPAEISQPIGFNLPEQFEEHVKISERESIYPPLHISTAVLNPKEPEQPTTGAQASVSEAGKGSAPQLSQSAQPEPQTQQPKRKPHPLAHIEVALQQMMAMGFTNDGGWLTQLLESKNGNIAAVLDLLTPINAKK